MTWIQIIAPAWLVLVLFGLIPGIFLVRPAGRWIIRRLRQPAGHCVTCGYDLRASSERCPECGTPIPPPSRGRGKTGDTGQRLSDPW